jgi:hypothetical protein
MEKKCYKCGDTKDASEFYKDKSRKDGIANICKICDKNKWKQSSRKRTGYKSKAYYGTATLKASEPGYHAEYDRRRKLYDEEDSLEKKKIQLIQELEAKMEASYEEEELFTIKWEII